MTSTPDRAFLAFSLGPVQTFIAAARTVRDLWTGSYLLSWLTRQAMEPLEPLFESGQAQLVSPAEALEFTAESLRSPGLPNLFVAEVPAASAVELAERCRANCEAGWREVADTVRRRLQAQVRDHFPEQAGSWARLWDEQIGSCFEMRTAVLPWAECDEALLRQVLAPDRRCTQGSAEQRLWTDRFELLGGLQSAGKLRRHVPDYRPAPNAEGWLPQKCSVLGTYEQMGPAELGQSRAFWAAFAEHVELRGTRTRPRERLCAVSLVKRFAWPALFAGEVESRPDRLRFEDTATVAAGTWLRLAEEKGFRLGPRHVRNWNGQWLHWPRPDFDPDERPCSDAVFAVIREARRPNNLGPPPAYYAILNLDGDNMGKKFRAGSGADHHRRLSAALAGFARGRVESIVEAEHDGTLIYAGGDDVLALLPTGRVVDCGRALSEAFRRNWEEEGLPDPQEATVSAGLVVVHYKEDLRFALQKARDAEETAKDSGRDALTLVVCRRSGEHTEASCRWSFVREALKGWVEAFLQGASDRWAYHLAAELPSLRGLPAAALRAEIERQLGRAEETTRRHLSPQRLGEAFMVYCQSLLEKERRPRDVRFWRRFPTEEAQKEELTDRALHGFITLCQSASFLARGRDR